jgi:hypothetical protein
MGSEKWLRIKVDSDILSTIAENIHWGREYG